jgi:hypothetical protein
VALPVNFWNDARFTQNSRSERDMTKVCMLVQLASPNRCYGSGFAVIEHSHSHRIAGDASKRSRKHETCQAASQASTTQPQLRRWDQASRLQRRCTYRPQKWLQDMRKSPMGGSDRCVGGERQSRIRPTVVIVFGQLPGLRPFRVN